MAPWSEFTFLASFTGSHGTRTSVLWCCLKLARVSSWQPDLFEQSSNGHIRGEENAWHASWGSGLRLFALPHDTTKESSDLCTEEVRKTVLWHSCEICMRSLFCLLLLAGRTGTMFKLWTLCCGLLVCGRGDSYPWERSLKQGQSDHLPSLQWVQHYTELLVRKLHSSYSNV